MFKVPELRRITSGQFATTKEDGNNGFFRVPLTHMLGTDWLNIVASDYGGWEHVSVTKNVKGHSVIPTWDEMCMIKDLFWGEEDEVIQIHPKKSEYVNLHPNCLHLWRTCNNEPPFPVPEADQYKE